MKSLLLVLLALFIVLQYTIWLGDGSLPRAWQLQAEVESQKIQNQALTERNQALDAEVRDLKEGLSAIEERARSELGMIKKGETFFQVIEE